MLMCHVDAYSRIQHIYMRARMHTHNNRQTI